MGKGVDHFVGEVHVTDWRKPATKENLDPDVVGLLERYEQLHILYELRLRNSATGCYELFIESPRQVSRAER